MEFLQILFSLFLETENELDRNDRTAIKRNFYGDLSVFSWTRLVIL